MHMYVFVQTMRLPVRASIVAEWRDDEDEELKRKELCASSFRGVSSEYVRKSRNCHEDGTFDADGG
jgi:hypothetical protein